MDVLLGGRQVEVAELPGRHAFANARRVGRKVVVVHRRVYQPCLCRGLEEQVAGRFGIGPIRQRHLADAEVIANDGHEVLGAILDAYEEGVRVAVFINHRVVDHAQGVPLVLDALHAVGDHAAVVAPGALVHHVADDDHHAAVGKIGHGAARAVLVAEAVVEQPAFLGPALQEVPLDHVGRVVVAEDELRAALADVERMRGRIGHGAAVLELAALEEHLAVAAQDAVLAVVEAAVADREVLPLRPNAGAVAVADAGPGELDVLHGEVAARHHPNGLAAGVLAVGRELGAAVADAADGEMVGPDRGHVARVNSGVDLDGVAVLGGLDRLRRLGELSDAARLSALRPGRR